MGNVTMQTSAGVTEVIGPDGARYTPAADGTFDVPAEQAFAFLRAGYDPKAIEDAEAVQNATLALLGLPCATEDRPEAPPAGFMVFDTDLGQPIWWNGQGWIDATGADPDA